MQPEPVIFKNNLDKNSHSVTNTLNYGRFIMNRTFFFLSIIFASILVILLIGSGPTDFGSGITPFAIPMSICSAGFAIASALSSRD